MHDTGTWRRNRIHDEFYLSIFIYKNVEYLNSIVPGVPVPGFFLSLDSLHPWTLYVPGLFTSLDSCYSRTLAFYSTYHNTLPSPSYLPATVHIGPLAVLPSYQYPYYLFQSFNLRTPFLFSFLVSLLLNSSLYMRTPFLFSYQHFSS